MNSLSDNQASWPLNLSPLNSKLDSIELGASASGEFMSTSPMHPHRVRKTSCSEKPHIRTNGSFPRPPCGSLSMPNSSHLSASSEITFDDCPPLASSEASTLTGSSANYQLSSSSPPVVRFVNFLTDGRSSIHSEDEIDAEAESLSSWIRSPTLEEEDDNNSSDDSRHKTCQNTVELKTKINSLKKKLRYYYEARHEISQRLTILKHDLSQIESQEMEVMREMEVERALLDGEYENELNQVRLDKEKMAYLGKEHANKIEHMVSERDKFRQQMELERLKLEELEEQQEKLNDRLLSAIKDSSEYKSLKLQMGILDEKVEQQRKIYEDFEFQQLEEQARFDEEKELLMQDLVSHQQRLLNQYQSREARLEALDSQQSQVLRNTRKQMEELDQLRQSKSDQLRKEQLRLGIAESKVRQISNDLASLESLTGSAQRKESNMAEIRQPSSLNGTLQEQHHTKNTSKYSAEISSDHSLNPAQTTSMDPPPPKYHFQNGKPPPTSSASNSSHVPKSSRSNSYQHCPASIFEPNKSKSLQKLHSNPVPNDGERFIWQSTHLISNSSGQDSGEPSTSDSTENCKDSLCGGRSAGSIDRLSENSGPLLSNIQPLRVRNKTPSYSSATSSPWRSKETRPLTRYLPAREVNFDLRRHIEASGHQLDVLASRIQVETSRCSGPLWKMGGKIRTWRKRWFVFDRTRRVLSYSANRTTSKIKGCISFTDIRDVFVDHLHRVKSPNPALTFCVETPKRTYYLVAHSAEIMRVWIDVIFSGAEGYLNLNPHDDSIGQDDLAEVREPDDE